MATESQSPGVSELHSVARLTTAEALQSKLDILKRARSSYENQWKLNLAFYKNKQYAYIDRLGRIQTLATQEPDMPRYRVRLINNQIVVGAQSLLAKFTKTKPIISASPGSASDHDVKAAQMAESLLEYWWLDMNLEDALEEALLWGIIAGQGYWKISWDQHAGKSMKFMLDPYGQPITNDSLKEHFRGYLDQMQIQPVEKTVYLGDIRVEAISPFDVYLDPSAKTFKDAKYAICTHYLSPDEIRTRWNIDVKPDASPTPADISLVPGSSTTGSDPSVKAIQIGYFLPSAALPQGRYVVWMAGPNTILEDAPWTAPMNELPLVKFPGVRVPGQIYDTSVVETAIPLQKELNRILSQIVEFKNLTLKPQMMAPRGSLGGEKVTNEPGAVMQYTPVAGLSPEWREMPNLQPWVFEHLAQISQRLKEVFSLSEVTEGDVPPNVEAGVAIDLLQEMSTDRLAPTIKLIEHAIGRAGGLMLSLAQRYYVEPRLLKIQGSGGGVQVKRFTQADIDGGVSVAVEAGSGLPRTRAGRQARIQSYVEMGILQPQQAWKYLDLADMKSVSKMWQADEDMAYREHDKMIRGVPINPEELAGAEMAVQQGINPQTQEPFATPEEAENFILQAMLTPPVFENTGSHLEVHALFMKSVEFESLPSDVKRRFMIHYQLSAQKLQDDTPPKEGVRTSLQLKGTVGPTGAAAILSKQGNPEITPEVMMEPPLETVVLDQIDKVDADAAGNDPLEPVEKQMQVLQTEELHEQNVRKAKADADLAEKKASQSDFRPKAKSDA
jgi:hypothetical protein